MSEPLCVLLPRGILPQDRVMTPLCILFLFCSYLFNQITYCLRTIPVRSLPTTTHALILGLKYIPSKRAPQEDKILGGVMPRSTLSCRYTPGFGTSRSFWLLLASFRTSICSTGGSRLVIIHVCPFPPATTCTSVQVNNEYTF